MEMFVKIELLFIWKVFHQEMKLLKFLHCFKNTHWKSCLMSNLHVLFFINRAVLTRGGPILKRCTLTWKKKLGLGKWLMASDYRLVASDYRLVFFSDLWLNQSKSIDGMKEGERDDKFQFFFVCLTVLVSLKIHVFIMILFKYHDQLHFWGFQFV